MARHDHILQPCLTALTFHKPFPSQKQQRYRGSRRKTSGDASLPSALPTRIRLVQRRSTPSQTHSTPAGCHGHDGRPLVGSRVVSLGTAELCCIISASHSIDHVLVHSTAQVLPPGPHGRNRVPAVLLGVVALHCRGKDTSVDKGVGRQRRRALLSP